MPYLTGEGEQNEVSKIVEPKRFYWSDSYMWIDRFIFCSRSKSECQCNHTRNSKDELKSR